MKFVIKSIPANLRGMGAALFHKVAPKRGALDISAETARIYQVMNNLHRREVALRSRQNDAARMALDCARANNPMGVRLAIRARHRLEGEWNESQAMKGTCDECISRLQRAVSMVEVKEVVESTNRKVDTLVSSTTVSDIERIMDAAQEQSENLALVSGLLTSPALAGGDEAAESIEMQELMAAADADRVATQAFGARGDEREQVTPDLESLLS
jgi:hypothetical protein